MDSDKSTLSQTKLFNQHQKLAAKIVEFAGYEMPITYPEGLIAEHKQVRASAGLFDVSHMGQIKITGEQAAKFLSIVTPTNIIDLPVAKAAYTVLLTEEATIIDDLIINRISQDQFLLVVNASNKHEDLAWLEQHAANYNLEINYLADRSLLALQGPQAAATLTKILPEQNLTALDYMSIAAANYYDSKLYVTRTGYTGEDGFEISVPNQAAEKLWLDILAESVVKPIGLAARDSLRLEMGYPLYGNDLSKQVNLSEATLKWIITSSEEFIGKNNLKTEITQRRVGFKLLDKGIARQHMEIVNEQQQRIGVVTSGGFSPSLEYAIGQACIDIAYAKKHTKIFIKVRNNLKAAEITPLKQLDPSVKN